MEYYIYITSLAAKYFIINFKTNEEMFVSYKDLEDYKVKVANNLRKKDRKVISKLSHDEIILDLERNQFFLKKEKKMDI